MRSNSLLVIIFFLLQPFSSAFAQKNSSTPLNLDSNLIIPDTNSYAEDLSSANNSDTVSTNTCSIIIGRDSIVGAEIIPLDELQKKKLISAMLAFPFPFGFVGAHRIMLGCKPWIPVVYVATFGGCFGILPLLDFFAIITSKDVSEFENNAHVFMWLK